MMSCRPIPGDSIAKIYGFEVMSSTEWATPQRTQFAQTLFVDIRKHMPTKMKALEAYHEEMRPAPHLRYMDHTHVLAWHRGYTVGIARRLKFTGSFVRCNIDSAGKHAPFGSPGILYPFFHTRNTLSIHQKHSNTFRTPDMPYYVIASSKPWHRHDFDEAAIKHCGRWAYVSTPDQLHCALTDDPKPRYLFFLHWNWIVPESICDAHECVCFHMTDVPYGRGGSPLQNLIVEGKSKTQVTALKMVKEMDAGPVYVKRSMGLEGRAEDIYLRASKICWQIIDWMIHCQPAPVPQEGSPTFFRRRKPEQSALPLTGSLEILYNHIRMLDAPTYPLAFLFYGDFKLEFSHARLTNGKIEAQVTFRTRKD